MRLIFVRHGETVENVNDIAQGHSPGKLTEKGKRQAQQVGELLKKILIDRIYVSNLKRAKDTAKYIQKYHSNARVVYDSNLRERSMGIYDGTSHLITNHPVRKSGLTYDNFKPPKGESLHDVDRRAKSFLQELHKRPKNETILVVSHDGLINLILKHIFRIPRNGKKYYPIKNAAVTILDIESNKSPKVHKLNSIQPLKN